jgi:hypothetical protein
MCAPAMGNGPATQPTAEINQSLAAFSGQRALDLELRVRHHRLRP